MAVAGLRRRHAEEEGESVFVSMTDLTVSFLFILLVLLAFFATQVQPDEVVPRGEHEALERELFEAHAAIIRLEEDLVTERLRLERLDQARRELADRLAEANDAKRQLEEALANERQRRERLEQEQRALVERLAEANRTIAQLRTLIEALRAELAVATAKIDDLSVQIVVLQRELELMRTERDDARARVELLEVQVEQLTRSLADCRRERDRLRMQLAEMLVQPDELVPRSEHEALERELFEVHAAIIRLEIDLVTERLRLERLERERRELADRLTEANETKRQLEEVLANERQRRERLEQEQRALVDRLADANRTIAELRTLIEALRAELAVATAKIDDLATQIVVLQRDLELMRTERDDARARVELLLAQVEQLTQSLADCRRERDRLRMQLAETLAPDSLASYLEDASAAREALLERLADLIRRRLPGIQVTVDTTDGVIRFRADELFPRGMWRIRPGSLAERVSHAIGDALAETLPCYTLSPSLDTEVLCEGTVAAIETIQIEGHTDDVGLSSELQEREQMRDNYDLSARRGAETLRVMIRKRPELHAFLNLRRQPVLSFAGYGETRPINQADTEEARAQNRRIDIRFILQTPRNLLEVEEIRSQLLRPRADLPSVVDENRP